MQMQENHAPSSAAKRRLLVAGAALFAVFGFFFYQVLDAGTGVMQYYHTLTEFQTAHNQGGVFNEKSDLRLNGFVKDDTIERNIEELSIDFVMTDGFVEQPVHLGRLDVSDLFKNGANVVVEGNLGTDGIFYADTLFAKCPTKYQAAEEAQQASRETDGNPAL